VSKSLPDLFDGCYDGEHRKLLAPEQFKQMFCGVCMNVGCRNSKGAGTKWNKRILTQEDRLLHNPDFAPENAATVLGLPDFPDMLRQALAIEISDQRGDWEPVTDADIGRAAAEMMGVVPPSGFQKEVISPEEPPEEPVEEPPTDSDPTDPATVTPDSSHEPSHGTEHQEIPDATPDPVDPFIGQWRVRGDSKDDKGKRVIYEVTLHHDGQWECTCPSRETPCKHARAISIKRARAADMMPPTEPAPNPTRPERRGPPPPPRPSFNTNMPTGGVMVGGGSPPPPEPDPWSAPTKPKERVIGVGGKITFGSGKKK